jgi:hypothetical protein
LHGTRNEWIDLHLESDIDKQRLTIFKTEDGYRFEMYGTREMSFNPVDTETIAKFILDHKKVKLIPSDTDYFGRIYKPCRSCGISAPIIQDGYCGRCIP